MTPDAGRSAVEPTSPSDGALHVTPASGTVGAFVEGVDLGDLLADAVRGQILDAWHQYGVLFLPWSAPQRRPTGGGGRGLR